jgi:hypothetical protein
VEQKTSAPLAKNALSISSLEDEKITFAALFERKRAHSSVG